MHQHPDQRPALALAAVLAAAGAFGAKPAACSTNRVQVYESWNPCCSVAFSQKCWMEKSA